MPVNATCRNLSPFSAIDLSDDDVLSAMKAIRGYIDITPGDFKEIYKIAFRYAVDRLSQSVTAGDIMTKTVVSVRPDTNLIEVARLMADAGISGVPVIDEGRRVVGVISEKDFFRRMGGNGAGSFMSVIAQCLSNQGCVTLPVQGKTATEIMTSPAITAELKTPVSELSRLLRGNNINRVPVVDDQGVLSGIVSRGDIVDSFCANVL